MKLRIYIDWNLKSWTLWPLYEYVNWSSVDGYDEARVSLIIGVLVIRIPRSL